MEQISDEVFAQVRETVVNARNRLGATRMSVGGEDEAALWDQYTAQLAAIDTAQPVQVNAGYGELEAVMSAEFESHGFGAPESNKREYGRFRVGFASGWHSALTAAKQAQPEQLADRLFAAVIDLATPEGGDVSDIGAQPERAGLTEAEVTDIAIKWSNSRFVAMSDRFVQDFAREILAAEKARRPA